MLIRGLHKKEPSNVSQTRRRVIVFLTFTVLLINGLRSEFYVRRYMTNVNCVIGIGGSASCSPLNLAQTFPGAFSCELLLLHILKSFLVSRISV